MARTDFARSRDLGCKLDNSQVLPEPPHESHRAGDTAVVRDCTCEAAANVCIVLSAAVVVSVLSGTVLCCLNRGSSRSPYSCDRRCVGKKSHLGCPCFFRWGIIFRWGFYSENRQWHPKGSHIYSNRDEATNSLQYINYETAYIISHFTRT